MLQENKRQKYQRHRIKVFLKNQDSLTQLKHSSAQNPTVSRLPGQSHPGPHNGHGASPPALRPLCSRGSAPGTRPRSSLLRSRSSHSDEHSLEQAVSAAIQRNTGTGCCRVRQHVPPDTGNTDPNASIVLLYE